MPGLARASHAFSAPRRTYAGTSPAMNATKKSRPRSGREVEIEIVLVLSEVIVHAGAHQSELVAVRHAGDGEVAVGEIDVEIFDLGAPVLGQAEFGADADGPAGTGVGFRQAEGLGAQFAEGKTAGAVDQDVVEGVADRGRAPCRTTGWRISTARTCRRRRSPGCRLRRRTPTVRSASCSRPARRRRNPLGLVRLLSTEPQA